MSQGSSSDLPRARRARHPVPPPPDPAAELWTFVECAGFLRIRRRALEELRRNDPTFPMSVLITRGAPRMRKVEVVAWVAKRPTGWASMGRRPKSARDVGDSGVVVLERAAVAS
jgi:hypothetical protein